MPKIKIKSQNFNTWTWKIFKERRNTLKDLNFVIFWPEFTQENDPENKNDIWKSWVFSPERTSGLIYTADSMEMWTVTFLPNKKDRYAAKKTWKKGIHSLKWSIPVNRLHNFGSSWTVPPKNRWFFHLERFWDNQFRARFFFSLCFDRVPDGGLSLRTGEDLD